MDRKHKIWSLNNTFNLFKKYAPDYCKEILGTLPSGRILVVGSAVSDNINTLESLFPCASQIMVIDISMKRLQGHIGVAKYPDRICLVQMDARRIAITENTIDLIISDYTLNLIDPPEMAMEQFKKILKDNGMMLLMLATHPREDPYFLETVIRQTYIYKDLDWKHKFRKLFNRLLIFDGNIKYTDSEMRIWSGYENMDVIIKRNDYYENLFTTAGFIWKRVFSLIPFRNKSHFEIVKNFGFSVAFRSNLYLIKKGDQ